jgi:hypothetical protein
MHTKLNRHPKLPFRQIPTQSSCHCPPRWNGTAFWNCYTALIGPGYCDTTESMVSSVTPSTVACATKILSKGSL